MKKFALLRALIAATTLYGTTTPANASRGPANFADLVQPLMPSVVNISTTTDTRKERKGDQLQQMSPEELFRQFMEEGPGAMQQKRPRKAFSLGSGFIIEQDKDTVYVATCNHLVADADEVNIILHDEKEEIPAQVVGRDRRTDLALLKFKSTKPLTVTKWGDSSKARVGEWLIAIGNPFGLSSTVTAGIVSTIARDIGPAGRMGAADYVDGYIQTDASINMGNSGGPMFNMNGEVVAISTAIFSPNGGSIGIGFGIPSNLAMQVIKQLKDFGRTKRGWVGIHIQQLDSSLAKAFGLKDSKGALISEVRPNSPAAKAGLKGEDIILTFGDKEVKDSKQIQHMIGDTPIGKKMAIVVWRNGKKINLEIEIAEYEKAEEEGLISNNDTPSPKKMHSQEVILGLVTRELTPAIADRLGLNPDIKGIMVDQVAPDSDAELKGIQRGDVLVRILAGGKKIELLKPDDLKKTVKEMEKAKEKTCTLVVRSGPNVRFVVIKISEEDDAESTMEENAADDTPIRKSPPAQKGK